MISSIDYFVWVLICCISIGTLRAQQPYLLTAEDNLPSNTVWRVTEDANGYLWFATDNGLARYDGNAFEQLDIEDGLLSKSVINCFWQNDSIMLASSYKRGINVINANTMQIERVVHEVMIGERLTEFDGRLYDSRPISFLVSAVWPQLEFHELEGVEVREIGSEVTFVYATPDNLFFLQNGDLYYLDQLDIKPYFDKNMEKDINTVHYADHVQWLAGRGYVAKFNQQGIYDVITKGLPEDGVVHEILAHASGKIYLSVIDYGLYIIEDNEAKQYGVNVGLGDININSFFLDSHENLWVSSFGKGVLCIPNASIKSFDSSSGLIVDEFNDFAYHEDLGMVAATSLGLLNISKNEFFDVPNSSSTGVSGFAGNGYTHVSRIDVDYDGNLLAECNGTKEQVGDIELDGLKLSYGRGWYVDFKNEERFELSEFLYPLDLKWFRRDIPKRNFDKWTGPGSVLHKDGLPTTACLDMHARGSAKFIDGSGRFWFESYGEGITFCQDEQIYHLTEILDKRFLGSTINATLERDGVILLGTNLGLFELSNDEFYESPYSASLKDKSVKALALDGAGGLWVGTSNGLDYFYKEKHLHWDKSDGLISNQLNALGYDPSENKLYVGFDSGMSVIELSKLLAEPKVEAGVAFCAFSSRGVVFDNFDNIDLDPGSNDVEISYTSLDFAKKNGKRFQYRLNGSEEKEWRNTTNTSIEFNSLQSDNYDFQVRPILSNGQPGETKTLSFKIDKVFWKKGSFFLGLAALSFLLLSLFFNRRLNVQKQAQEKEREVEKKIKNLEYQALSAMMNPHFIFNSLNSIQYFYNSKDLISANEFLSQFAKLIRMNLDMADQSSVPLEDELDRLELYVQLEQMRLGDIFDYEINIDEDIDADSIYIPSMMIQPYVENAVFHGIRMNQKRGQITISVEPEPADHLTISIIDNGIGINQSKARKKTLNANHESKGMRINAERIEILGQGDSLSKVSVEEMQDATGSVLGTKVSIVIPDTLG